MPQPAANLGSMVAGVDIHIVLVPTPGGPVPTPMPHPFNGPLNGALANTVLIAGQPAAVVDSIAVNQPPHIPTPPGVAFQNPPANQGTVVTGSRTVLLAGKGAARVGDPVKTCNDPADAPTCAIVSGSTVLIG